MPYQNLLEGNEITVFADSSVFSKEAILKSLYWYGDKFYINIGLADESTYRLSLRPLSDSPLKLAELSYYLQKLERDLIDFQLRVIISKETVNIRDLLVAKAFSNGEFDEEPPGEITDPVGFDPNSIIQIP